MASLEHIRSSNSKISTTLRPGLVAVFAGATSGIGESALRQFAKNAIKPRIYFLGRSKQSGDRVRAELKKLNPDGEYIFISVDVSLLRSVDDVCRQIKEKETAINLLFLSTGTMISGQDTEEGLNYATAVAYFARLRFTVNLLPQLQKATDLRRVVSVMAGTKEGPINMDDLDGRTTNMFTPSGRGHFCSMMTLSLEAIAKTAPSVSFVHDYPGFVKTNIGNDVKGLTFAIMKAIWEAVTLVIGPFLATPFDEAGERQLFFATSGRFPGGGDGSAAGVPVPEGVKVAQGTDGNLASGVYSITNHAETAPVKVDQLLEKFRKDGTAQKVWAQVQKEFIRITGVASM
ncbi:hypothetical protein F5144DRAFT_505963 [Chaetomium tenue]|uniref:Uncharacterized protein n=1 Tax=Chaetomium tenue TaxID=1854479 RepID=A0ACB7PHN8_9PEZI|nr:hypothetical protein F5144DRAFT_505963 [Chaetomium globosum]